MLKPAVRKEIKGDTPEAAAERLDLADEAALADVEEVRLEAGVAAVVAGEDGVHLGEDVFIDEGTIIEPGAVIKGPAWIGRNCQIRAGCYIRENVIVGNDAVLGNSCEFKNCIVFDGAQVPHFNYVGDSILGHKAHLGAGVILSNVRLDHGEVIVRGPDGGMPTGLKKFGAIIGDGAEVGCNSVLSPGSLIGRQAVIHPCVHWKGILPARTVAKLRQQIEQVARD